MIALGRSGLNQIIYQPQGVLFVPNVAKRIISVALLQIDEIQYPDVVSVLLQPAARGQQDLALGVRDHIICVRLQDVGLHI